MDRQIQNQPYCNYCVHKGILQDCGKCQKSFNQAYSILQENDAGVENEHKLYTVDEIKELLNKREKEKERNNEMAIWLDLIAFVIDDKKNFDEEFNRICEKYNINKEKLLKKIKINGTDL